MEEIMDIAVTIPKNEFKNVQKKEIRAKKQNRSAICFWKIRYEEKN